jgi:hypothetical protein
MSVIFNVEREQTGANRSKLTGRWYTMDKSALPKGKMRYWYFIRVGKRAGVKGSDQRRQKASKALKCTKSGKGTRASA